MNGFWSYWYFHLPNYVLAALMYTMIGRLVLGFFVPDEWDNYIWRAFKAITQPVAHGVRYVTPVLLGQPAVMLFSVFWLMALRLAWLLVLARLGLAPIGQGASS